MRPQYIQLRGTTPQVVLLNNNNHDFNVAIRAPVGVTVEVTLEDPVDPAVAANLPNSGSPGQTWTAAPAAVAGVINLLVPARCVRLTPTVDAQVTILQQGLQ
jgi:hypothetical protein